jgi:hypothetical protein
MRTTGAVILILLGILHAWSQSTQPSLLFSRSDIVGRDIGCGKFDYNSKNPLPYCQLSDGLSSAEYSCKSNPKCKVSVISSVSSGTTVCWRSSSSKHKSKMCRPQSQRQSLRMATAFTWKVHLSHEHTVKAILCWFLPRPSKTFRLMSTWHVDDERLSANSSILHRLISCSLLKIITIS